MAPARRVPDRAAGRQPVSSPGLQPSPLRTARMGRRSRRARRARGALGRPRRRGGAPRSRGAANPFPDLRRPPRRRSPRRRSRRPTSRHRHPVPVGVYVQRRQAGRRDHRERVQLGPQLAQRCQLPEATGLVPEPGRFDYDERAPAQGLRDLLQRRHVQHASQRGHLLRHAGGPPMPEAPAPLPLAPGGQNRTPA